MPSPNPNLHVAAGNSGSVTVVDTGHTMDTGSWTLTKTRDMAEVTHSGSQGWKQRKATVRDFSGTVELPWNSVNTPESKGFDIGAEVTLTLQLADSGKSYTAPSLINSLAFKVDQTDAVRLTVNFMANGPLTGPA
jgi:hypothetical protein